jgi:hypothetical protein
MKIIAFAAVAIGIATAAMAQSSVSEVRFEHPDWNFVPVMDGGITESIVAFDRNALSAGNKIVAIWYLREGAGWSTKA